MARNWTENQQKAIDVRDKNVLVSAAAGSGKTAVLVERIRKMLSREETDIDKVLIATFTNAAAGEMRSRILESLNEQLEKDNTNEFLRRQAVMFDRANIGTIHSFCQTLIRNNFHRLGLASDFKIGDETEIAIIKSDALDAVMEEYYQAEEPGFLWLADGYGGKKNDEDLRALVFALHDFAGTTKNPDAWFDKCRDMFVPVGNENEFISDTWGKVYTEAQLPELENVMYRYDGMLKMTDARQEDKLHAFLEKEAAMAEELLECARLCDWNKLFLKLGEVNFRTIPRKTDETDPELHEYVKETRNEIKAVIKGIKEIVCGSAEDICAQTVSMQPLINALCSLTQDFGAAFAQLKREKNLIDFSDLEQFTIKLLSENPEEFKDTFNQILIDEFQDTNEAQNEIFSMLDNGRNIFVVGDVKQSIYRFRNAQPQLFSARAERYASGSGSETIRLSNNFRSSDAILDFANGVFETVMSKSVGEVDYTEEERLVYSGGGGTEGAVELHIVEKDLSEDEELTEEELQTDWIQREARLTAHRIAELIEKEKPEIFDKELGCTRPAEYRDITILMRATKGKSTVYASELAALGIPVYNEESGGFFASAEIATVLSMLKIIDNPLQNIPVLAVLRSPIFGFTDDELVELKGRGKGSSFFSRLKKSDSEKCIYAAAKIEEYMEKAAYMPLEELIRFILSDTGYEAYVSAMPNSEIRLMNLKLLCDRAGSFKSDGCSSVSDFIAYINTLADTETFTMAKIISENDNAVKIMSIHKSKGLEFPIVFLVNTGAQFNEADTKGKILHDLDMGLGAEYVDAYKRFSFTHLSKRAIAIKKARQSRSEEMRVLYVALTRPINRLFIFGSVKNIGKDIGRLDEAVYASGRLLPYYAQKQRTYLGWLYLGVKGMDGVQIQYHCANDVLTGSRNIYAGDVLREEYADDEIDEGIYENISRRFAFEYPFKAANIPSKLSVSMLLSEDDRAMSLPEPDFMHSTAAITPSTRGTIIHFVMQNLDINDTDTHDAVKAQIDGMTGSGMITGEFAGVVDSEKIYEFFCSDIGRRMRASDNVMREYQFIAEFDARELMDTDQQETVLLQGIVDCFFEEPDGLVIVDYKTGNVELNAEKYNRQLDLYSRSLSKIFGKPVKECHICDL